MAMHNLYLLPYDNVPEYWEEGEDGWEGRLSIDDKEGYMVDLEAIREVPHTGSAFVCMGNNDDFMAAINELRR